MGKPENLNPYTQAVIIPYPYRRDRRHSEKRSMGFLYPIAYHESRGKIQFQSQNKQKNSTFKLNYLVYAIKAREKTLNKTTQKTNELCVCTFIIHYDFLLPSLTLKRCSKMFLQTADHKGKFCYENMMMTQVIIFSVKYRNFQTCGLLLSVWIECNISLANFWRINQENKSK